MTSENKKFVELVAPDSVFEAAGGRVGLFGYSTTQETLRMQYGASPTAHVAFMAKRNGANTFTGLQTFGAGFVNTLWVGAGFRPLIANAEGVGQPTDAATFMSSGLGISSFAQTILDDADASAVRSTIGAQGALGYTPVNKAGDTMMGGLSISGTLSANDVLIRNQSGTNQSIGYLHSTTGNLRLITRFDETLDSFDTVTRDDSGNPRNTALSIPRATATAVNAGGSGGQPWNFTGGVWTGGTPRVSATGRFDATSLYNSAWAGAGSRPLLTDNAGMGYATDAATFRGVIGAADASRADTRLHKLIDNDLIGVGTTETELCSYTVPSDAIVTRVSALRVVIDLYTPRAGSVIRVKYAGYTVAEVTTVAISTSGLYRFELYFYGVPSSGAVYGLYVNWTCSGEVSASDSWNNPDPNHATTQPLLLTVQSAGGTAYVALSSFLVYKI